MFDRLAVKYSTYAETPVHVSVSMSVLSIATNIIRILRNMCTGCPANQATVLHSGIIRSVLGYRDHFHTVDCRFV